MLCRSCAISREPVEIFKVFVFRSITMFKMSSVDIYNYIFFLNLFKSHLDFFLLLTIIRIDFDFDLVRSKNRGRNSMPATEAATAEGQDSSPWRRSRTSKPYDARNSTPMGNCTLWDLTRRRWEYARIQSFTMSGEKKRFFFFTRLLQCLSLIWSIHLSRPTSFTVELNLFLNIPLPLSSILFPFIPDLFITVFRRIDGSIKYIRSSLTSNL